jgi:hypothetical protein
MALEKEWLFEIKTKLIQVKFVKLVNSLTLLF